MLRKWDSTNEPLQRKCLEEVIARIEDIDDTASVGIIAAQDIVDIVLENLGPEIYNKGVKDASNIMTEKFQSIEVDIAALEQQ